MADVALRIEHDGGTISTLEGVEALA